QAYKVPVGRSWRHNHLREHVAEGEDLSAADALFYASEGSVVDVLPDAPQALARVRLVEREALRQPGRPQRGPEREERQLDTAGISETPTGDADRLGKVDHDQLPALGFEEEAPPAATTPEIADPRILQRGEINEIEVLTELELVLRQHGREFRPLLAKRELDI